MALVNYTSDSDSENESPQPVPPAAKPKTSTTTTTATGQAKKPFQKLVDRSEPGKIRVTLPGAKPDGNPNPDPDADADGDERPAKRAKKAGGMFASFNDFLPKPKNAAGRGLAAGKTTATTTTGTAGTSSVGKPVGLGLKTGAGPGFIRDASFSGEGQGAGQGTAARAEKGPEIPEGMKREEDVKLVGKPLMFKPLCVTRKAAAKKKKPAGVVPSGATAAGAAGGEISQAAAQTSTANAPSEPPAPKAQEQPPPPEKMSLFSIPDLEPDAPAAEPQPDPSYNPVYQPLYQPPSYPQYHQGHEQPPPSEPQQEETLESLASTMNLPPSAHRDLFGRSGPQSAATMANAKVLSFDTDAEYARNNELAASGALQAHQRVSKPTIQGMGKHSLRQLVGAVVNQREALEESFARGKGKRKDAGARYGW